MRNIIKTCSKQRLEPGTVAVVNLGISEGKVSLVGLLSVLNGDEKRVEREINTVTYL